MKGLISILDANGYPLVGFNSSDCVDTRVLAATVAEVITVPTGAKKVLFSSTADFYVKFGAAAAIPVADITDGSGSELNPKLRSIEGSATIGIISPTSCVVTIAFYA